MIDILIGNIRFFHMGIEKKDRCLLHKGDEIDNKRIIGKKIWLGTTTHAVFFPSRHKVICEMCMKEFMKLTNIERKTMLALWKIKEKK